MTVSISFLFPSHVSKTTWNSLVNVVALARMSYTIFHVCIATALQAQGPFSILPIRLAWQLFRTTTKRRPFKTTTVGRARSNAFQNRVTRVSTKLKMSAEIFKSDALYRRRAGTTHIVERTASVGCAMAGTFENVSENHKQTRKEVGGQSVRLKIVMQSLQRQNACCHVRYWCSRMHISSIQRKATTTAQCRRKIRKKKKSGRTCKATAERRQATPIILATFTRMIYSSKSSQVFWIVKVPRREREKKKKKKTYFSLDLLWFFFPPSNLFIFIYFSSARPVMWNTSVTCRLV